MKYISLLMVVLFWDCSYSQKSPYSVEKDATIPIYQYCDENGDGFATINIRGIEEAILQQNPTLFDALGTIYLSGFNNTFYKVTNLISGPQIATVCYQDNYEDVDIGVDHNGDVYLSGYDDSGAGTYKINTTTCQRTFISPFLSNLLTFDSNNNMYLTQDSQIIRLAPPNYTTVTLWKDFGFGHSGGDMVYHNGKFYVAWFDNTLGFRLYEVTVDQNFNYISHIDLGQLPARTFGLASELGRLYGVTPEILYEVNLSGMTFTTILTNSLNEWSGASSLHEAGFGLNAFATIADATNHTNPLPDSWVNTVVGGQIIYVNIFDPITNTNNLFPVQLVISNPVAHQPENMELCETDLDEFIQFNLGNQSPVVLSGQSSVTNTLTYHLTQNDADLGINPLPLLYTNISNPQNIYARLENQLDVNCYDTNSFQLIVYKKPVIEMEDEFAICNNQSFRINAPDGFAAYSWSTGATTSYIDIDSAGFYEVHVTDDKGCSNEKGVTVITEFCSIPNVITPNNDGLNESFDLEGFEVRVLEVYNRWGRKVYEKNNYLNEWYGQNMSGGILPDSTYYYIIKLSTEEIKNGWIFLNRG